MKRDYAVVLVGKLYDLNLNILLQTKRTGLQMMSSEIYGWKAKQVSNIGSLWRPSGMLEYLYLSYSK
jgi:hypothetical protein